MMDSLFKITENCQSFNRMDTLHGTMAARCCWERWHVRSDIVPVRGLQRCPCVEPKIRTTGGQWLEKEEMIEPAQQPRPLQERAGSRLLMVASDVHFWRTSSLLACRELPGVHLHCRKIRRHEFSKRKDKDGFWCDGTHRCKTACEQSAQLRGRDRFCKPT
jgi:hypothetical protein